MPSSLAPKAPHPRSTRTTRQWKRQTHRNPLQLIHLKRAHVAGDGLKLLSDIVAKFATKEEKAHTKLEGGRWIRGIALVPKLPVTFDEGEDASFSLLAIPNVTAAVFMVSERGQELGFWGIESITVEIGKSIIINFHTGVRPLSRR